MKKTVFFVGTLIFLNSCIQSTAMVGPSLTLAGGGNIYQSSISYGASKIFEAEIYFLSKLPAKVDSLEVITVTGLALALSFLATLYPSWRAARLDPVEALRYE